MAGAEADAQYARFLAAHGDAYGRFGADGSLRIDELRRTEFARLSQPGAPVYLDHAGATLYAEAQVAATAELLRGAVLGNPHTAGPASADTAARIAQVRRDVLAFFGGGRTHRVVFTAGATASFKLVAECFDWGPGSTLAYTHDSHNSVLGMRELAAAAGAAWRCLNDDEFDSAAAGAGTGAAARGGSGEGGGEGSSEGGDSGGDAEVCASLLVYPAECNFSGRKRALGAAGAVQRHGLPTLAIDRDGSGGGGGGAGTAAAAAAAAAARGGGAAARRWFVMLDAAKFAATAPLDLGRCDADFVAVSFYKICGLPTGLGALLVRRGAAERVLCRKRYFGGGTVLGASAAEAFHARRPSLAAWLEDGTLPFLSIAALRPGLALLRRLTMAAVRRHTFALTAHLRDRLAALRHGGGGGGGGGGAPVCELYGNHRADGRRGNGPDVQGAVVAFSVLRADGSYVGYAEVERLAAISGLQLRTGCFCNPGACAHFLRLTAAQLREAREAGHVCWDGHDLVAGRPTGAVRLSLGYMSTYADCEAAVALVQEHFVTAGEASAASAPPARLSAAGGGGGGGGGGAVAVVESIMLYPVKSCAAFEVGSWPVVAAGGGLLHDRQWSVVDADGAVVTQRRAPAMVRLRPVVDLEAGTLLIALPEPAASTTTEGGGSGGGGGGGGADYPVGPLVVALSAGARGAAAASERTTTVCGDSVCTLAAELPEGSAWFSAVLGFPCSFVRALGARGATRQSSPPPPPPPPPSSSSPPAPAPAGVGVAAGVAAGVTFANTGQLLLLSDASVAHLNGRLAAARVPTVVSAATFRPNLFVRGAAGMEAHAEDRWARFAIGGVRFAVSEQCTRCPMVNIDQRSGATLREPLLTMSKYRRQLPGKTPRGILFGVYCAAAGDDQGGGSGGGGGGRGVIRVGDAVTGVELAEDADTRAVLR